MAEITQPPLAYLNRYHSTEPPAYTPNEAPGEICIDMADLPPYSQSPTAQESHRPSEHTLKDSWCNICCEWCCDICHDCFCEDCGYILIGLLGFGGVTGMVVGLWLLYCGAH
jgi:hypothetical protein